MTGPLLAVHGLGHAYRGRAVLEEVSFELAAGEIMYLLGPNGSGKSTLLKLLGGVLDLAAPGPATGGRILFSGQDLLALSSRARAQRIAYVPADLRAEFPVTAREAVALGRSCLRGGAGITMPGRDSVGDAQAVREAMERTECWELRERELATLSGGERQLVAFARSLAQGAKVLLLDESLSRMDLHHQARVGRLIREFTRVDARAAILVSHDINLASEWADSCLILLSGRRVACGRLRETLTEANLNGLYPGAGIEIHPSPTSGAPKVFFGALQDTR